MPRIWKRAAALAACAALAWATGVAAQETKVEEGKPAPAVNLPAANVEKVLPDKKAAKTLSLKDLQGKKHVVLYFFPKAMTAG